MKRNILCIDLKSFFASVECVDRGLDILTTSLVVANTMQGRGAITLAVTPTLKALGVKGRTRLYDIPKDISYKIVNPRMTRYIEVSKQIIEIYLDFISSEDLHIYSIDECFLDVTDYLKLYKKSDLELAETILNTIQEKTGLLATCGIGPNMLLSKLSMDIEAKHTKSGIAKWTLLDIPEKLWPIKPLSTMWGIGSKLEKRLNSLGICTIGDLAHADKLLLKKKFGIIGIELWEHANGIDESIIHDFQNPSSEKSISHSQVLYRNYYGDEILLIVREMIEVLVRRLLQNQLNTCCIHLSLYYSKEIGGGVFHSMTLETPTNLVSEILKVCTFLVDYYYDGISPIRKVGLSFSKLTKQNGIQLNLFESFQEKQTEAKTIRIFDEIKSSFGKNSIYYASALLSYSTTIEQNKKIGGHHA